MKKVIIFLCSISIIFILGNVHSAFSWHIVVDDDYDNVNPDTACTSSNDNLYYDNIQAAADYLKDINADIRQGSVGSEVIICPGVYNENVHFRRAGARGWHYALTIRGYASVEDDPAHIIAANPSKNALFIENPGLNGVTVKNLKIEGATGNECSVESGISVPCAGIRVYCTESGRIMNNEISGNNHGIIIKDTAYSWNFFYVMENNNIHDNMTGIKLKYGRDSYIFNNQIHDNTAAGVMLADTWTNVVHSNTIENNGIGISVTSENYNPGEATSGNMIYHNTFNSNTTDYYDNSPGIVEKNIDCASLPPIGDPQCGPNCEWQHHLCDVCPDTDSDGLLECQHYWYSTKLQEGNRWKSHDIPSEGCDDTDGDGLCDDPYNYDLYPFALRCDLDNNGIVEWYDGLVILKAEWANPNNPNWNRNADRDLNDYIDYSDWLDWFLSFWDGTCPELN